jgi:uncharacterized delta-60 repeat protein
VAIRPDGRIVVAGDAKPGNEFFPNFGFAVEQFNPDGSPDLNFGSHGITTYVYPPRYAGQFNATGLVLQRDGSVVVAGTTDLVIATPFSFQSVIGFAMIRLQPDGTFDQSFGSGGVVTTTFPNPQAFGLPIMLAQEPNGNLVVAGTTFDTTNGLFELGLAEYLAGPSDVGLSRESETASAADVAPLNVGIGITAAAIPQPSAPVSQANESTGSASLLGSTNPSATALSTAGGTRADAFFTALSGGAAHVPSNPEDSFLKKIDPGVIDKLFSLID